MRRSNASRLISAVSATALTLIAPASPPALAQDLSSSGPSAADCAALGFRTRGAPPSYLPPVYTPPGIVTPPPRFGPLSFNIPVGDAATSLAAWAAVSGVKVDAPASLLRGVRTAAVSGTMDPRDALRSMIAGGKLAIVMDDGSRVSLGSAAGDTVSSFNLAAAGTNIPEVKTVGSPVQRVTREELLKSGATDIRSALQTLPLIQTAGGVGDTGGVGGLQPREVAALPPPPAALQARPAPPVQNASVALAAPPPPSPAGPGGQGSRATLGLLDGQRLAQSGLNTASTVINQVPMSALGSIQVPSRDAYADVAVNSVKQVASDPVSTFSIDVDTASYANVRRFLNDGRKPPADSVRVEEMVNYFDYSYPLPTNKAEPFRPFVAVAPSPFNAGRQIIHVGLQGYALPRDARPPLNLVFLVDTSGSMGSADRLPLAQKALNTLIDQLRPQDHVSLVAYAGVAGLVLGPTAGNDKARIRCAVDALQSGGSTAGGAGLSLAYSVAQQTFQKEGVNRIVLMTDGDFNVGTTDNKRLEDYVAEKRKTGVYLSVYGFGRDNYQDDRMQVIAQNGNGTAAYVDNLNEARKLFRDDFSGSVFPIADDVKIQVEFNPARVSEYRLIGYETRMLKREDFNNDAVDAGEVGSGASVTALYEVTPVGAQGSVDPLRYTPAKAASNSGGQELAFLKVRYKAPGGTQSKLMQRPITDADRSPSLARAPEATRWAVAVAGFGEKLRGDTGVSPSFSWSQDRDLAMSAKGEDLFGLRSEFIQLTRSAEERSLASR